MKRTCTACQRRATWNYIFRFAQRLLRNPMLTSRSVASQLILFTPKTVRATQVEEKLHGLGAEDSVLDLLLVVVDLARVAEPHVDVSDPCYHDLVAEICCAFQTSKVHQLSSHIHHFKNPALETRIAEIFTRQKASLPTSFFLAEMA
jgi:hypothetical protein